MATPLDFDSASRRQTNDNPDFNRTASQSGMNRQQRMSMILRLLGRAYGPMKKAPIKDFQPYTGREGNQHG